MARTHPQKDGPHSADRHRQRRVHTERHRREKRRAGPAEEKIKVKTINYTRRKGSHQILPRRTSLSSPEPPPPPPPQTGTLCIISPHIIHIHADTPCQGTQMLLPVEDSLHQTLTSATVSAKAPLALSTARTPPLPFLSLFPLR